MPGQQLFILMKEGSRSTVSRILQLKRPTMTQMVRTDWEHQVRFRTNPSGNRMVVAGTISWEPVYLNHNRWGLRGQPMQAGLSSGPIVNDDDHHHHHHHDNYRHCHCHCNYNNNNRYSSNSNQKKNNRKKQQTVAIAVVTVQTSRLWQSIAATITTNTVVMVAPGTFFTSNPRDYSQNDNVALLGVK